MQVFLLEVNIVKLSNSKLLMEELKSKQIEIIVNSYYVNLSNLDLNSSFCNNSNK